MHTSHRWFLTIDRRVSARDATGPDAGTGNETSVRRCVRSSRVALPCSTTADQQAKIKAIVAEQEPRVQTVSAGVSISTVTSAPWDSVLCAGQLCATRSSIAA